MSDNLGSLPRVLTYANGNDAQACGAAGSSVKQRVAGPMDAPVTSSYGIVHVSTLRPSAVDSCQQLCGDAPRHNDGCLSSEDIIRYPKVNATALTHHSQPRRCRPAA